MASRVSFLLSFFVLYCCLIHYQDVLTENDGYLLFLSCVMFVCPLLILPLICFVIYLHLFLHDIHFAFFAFDPMAILTVVFWLKLKSVWRNQRDLGFSSRDTSEGCPCTSFTARTNRSLSTLYLSMIPTSR